MNSHHFRTGGNPFKKVSGLLHAMIVKLSQEAESESTEKAYCDEQMAKTKAKKAFRGPRGFGIL